MKPKSEEELMQECNALWSQINMCSAPTSECVIVVNSEFLQNLKFHWRPANLYGFVQERDRYFLFGCEVLISQIQQSWRLLVNPDALIQRGVL